MEVNQSNITRNDYTALDLDGKNGIACGFSSEGGLYYTTDCGKTWTLSSFYGGRTHSNTDGIFNCGAISGTNAVATGQLYPSYGGQGTIFDSSNSGVIFDRTNINYMDYALSIYLNGSVGVASVNGDNSYHSGAYYSNNSGHTWTQSLYEMGTEKCAMDGYNGIVGTGYNGIYYTQNGGETWTQSNIKVGQFPCVSFSGQNGIAGTLGFYGLSEFKNFGIYYTNDGGKNWYKSNINYGNEENNSFYIDFNSVSISGNNAIAGGFYNNSIYYSTDAGQNWSKANININNINNDPRMAVTKLHLDGSNGLAGSFSEKGIFYTTDAGNNWNNLPLYDADARPINISSVYLSGSYGLIGSGSNTGCYYIGVYIDLEPDFFKEYGVDNNFSLDPSSNSPETFLYSSSNESVAIVDSTGNVTIIGPGIATINVSQNALPNYYSSVATTNVYVKGISEITTSISVNSFNKMYGDAPFLLNASSNSISKLKYSSSNTSIANVDDNGLITILSSGVVSITITQDSIPDYYTSSIAYSTITIEPQTTLINVPTSFIKKIGDEPFKLIASSNSPENFNFSSSNNNVASVDANTGMVSIVGRGIANIIVSQNSNPNYTSATSTSEINVGQNFINVTPSFEVLYGSLPFNLNARSLSKSVITYNSSNTSIAVVDSNGLVKIGGVGDAVITLYQEENSNFSSATATTNIHVSPQQTIINVVNAFNKEYNSSEFNLRARSNSSEPFEYSSSDVYVVMVDSDGIVSINNIGIAEITISQNATDKFSSASTITTITIS